MKYSLIVISYFLLLVCSCGNKQSKGIKSDDDLTADTTKDSLVQEEQDTTRDSLAHEKLKTHTVFPIKKSNHVGYYFSGGKPLLLKALDLRNGEVLSEIELPEECSSGDIFIDTVSNHIVINGTRMCIINSQNKEVIMVPDAEHGTYFGMQGLDFRKDTIWCKTFDTYHLELEKTWVKDDSIGITLTAFKWFEQPEKFKLKHKFEREKGESIVAMPEWNLVVVSRFYLQENVWLFHSADTMINVQDYYSSWKFCANDLECCELGGAGSVCSSGYELENRNLPRLDEICEDNFRPIIAEIDGMDLRLIDTKGNLGVAVGCVHAGCDTWMQAMYKKVNNQWIEIEFPSDQAATVYKVVNETEVYLATRIGEQMRKKPWHGLYNTEKGEFVYQKEFD